MFGSDILLINSDLLRSQIDIIIDDVTFPLLPAVPTDMPAMSGDLEDICDIREWEEEHP